MVYITISVDCEFVFDSLVLCLGVMLCFGIGILILCDLTRGCVGCCRLFDSDWFCVMVCVIVFCCLLFGFGCLACFILIVLFVLLSLFCLLSILGLVVGCLLCDCC